MPHKGDRPQGFKVGNFNGGSEQTIKNLALPQKVKCNICGRNKDVNQFSNNQLEKARARIAAGAYGHFDMRKKRGPPDIVSCRECTLEPVTELCCILCSQVKELSQFAKQQRKNPDNAKCFDCNEAVLRVGEGEEKLVFDDPGDGLSDGEYDAYSDDDDQVSVGTGIRSPWAQYGDGNYVTNDDVESGRWPSEAGSTNNGLSRNSNRSSYGGKSLTKENVRAFNHRGGRGFGSSYATPTSARTVSHTSHHTDINLMDADSRYNSKKDEDEYNFDDASQLAGNISESGEPGRPFRSWGPQGQNAIHYRVPSTAMSGGNGSATRPAGNRNFANDPSTDYVRPKYNRGREDSNNNAVRNNAARNNRRFPKVRPDNSLEASGYYEQNGDLGQNGWKKDPSLW